MSPENELKPKMSEQISDFCAMVESIRLDYAWNQSEVLRCEQLTQDYLHKLELGNLNYKERAKIATQLAECRQQRRQSKDTVEILEAFALFIESEKGKIMVNLMQEALGKTRKAEQLMENRTYRFRVLDEKPIYSKPHTPSKSKEGTKAKSKTELSTESKQKSIVDPVKDETVKQSVQPEKLSPTATGTPVIENPVSPEYLKSVLGKSKSKPRGRRKKHHKH